MNACAKIYEKSMAKGHYKLRFNAAVTIKKLNYHCPIQQSYCQTKNYQHVYSELWLNGEKHDYQ